MSDDAKELHKLINQRNDQQKSNEEKLKKENEERLNSLMKIRAENSNMRNAKNDAKEMERQKLSRTLFSNLVSSSDFPDSPSFVPHMINVLKNILGN